MADAVTRKVVLGGEGDLLPLLGRNDENLRVLESQLALQIVARGNELILKGEPRSVAKAERLLGEMEELVRAGQTIHGYEIEAALRILTEAPEADVKAIFLEAIPVPLRKKQISPKTLNQKRYIEAIRGYDVVIGIGPAGTGKCIAGSSLVLTNQGLLRIETIGAGTKPGQYAPIDLAVSSLDGIESASHIYSGGKSPTKRISTRSGFEIEATPEHPLLQLTPEGEVLWRRVDELKTGDCIAIQRGQNLFGHQTEIHFRYSSNGPQDHAKPIHIDYLDEDLAYFMGILTGDGCLTFKNRVILSNADEEILACFYRTAARLGLHVFRNGQGRPYDRIIASAQLYQLLLHLGMSDRKAADKRVPESILRAPREIVAAFLRGLFDTDGTVSRRDGYPILYSSSKRLIDEVQILLLNFGILAHKRLKRTVYQGEQRVSHLLEIAGIEADRFYEEIGVGLSRKRKLRQTRRRNTNVDVIPHVHQLVEAAVAGATLSRAIHKSLGDYKGGRRDPSYEKLGEIIGILKSHAPTSPPLARLEELHDLHLFWVEITGIEDREADVYDLTVPGSHSFCANGFVNHNTYLAMAMAVSAMTRREVSRIILTRPAVEAGERLGFLPGDMYEKVHPYLRPLYDALYDMLEAEKVAALVERGAIEIAPLAYMRGRTLNDAFIILDEAQNTTSEQMKMFLTRLGFNSKMVITGDITQVDLPAGRASGLIEVQTVLKGIEGIRFVYFTEKDVVRHELVSEIIRAYEEHGQAREAPSAGK